MGASEKVVWAFIIFVLLAIIGVLVVAGSVVGAVATVGALILDLMYWTGG